MQYNKTIGLPICALLVFSGCSNNTNQPSESSQASTLVLTRDAEGYDAEGYNPLGLNKDGFDRRGYDAHGCDKDGLDFFGMTCADRKDFAENKVTYQTYTNLQAQFIAETARAGTCTTDLATCVAERNDRGTKLATATAEITTLKESIDEKNTELAAKQITITEKEKTIETLAADRVQLNLQATTNYQRIEALDQKVAALEASVAQKNTQIAQLADEAFKKNELLQQKVKEIADINSKQQQAGDKFKQLTAEKEELNKQIVSLQENLQKQQEIATLNAASSEASNEDELQKTIGKIKQIAEKLPREDKPENITWTEDTLVKFVEKIVDERLQVKRNLKSSLENGSPTKLSGIPLGDVTNNNSSKLLTPEKQQNSSTVSTPGSEVGKGLDDCDLFSSSADSDDDVGPPPENS